MKNQITITYNHEQDETKVTFSEGYRTIYDIAQLDMLHDALYELTIKYNRVLGAIIEESDNKEVMEAVLTNLGHRTLEHQF